MLDPWKPMQAILVGNCLVDINLLIFPGKAHLSEAALDHKEFENN